MRIRVIISFLIAALLYSCSSVNQTVTHAKPLRNCLEQPSLLLLDEMVITFEASLDQSYGDHSFKEYRAYLEDIVQFNVPKALMQDDTYLKASHQYKDSDIYATLKIKESIRFPDREPIEIPPVEGQPEQEPYDPLVINPESTYIQCLESSADLASLDQILKDIHKGVELNPYLIASISLNSLNPDDLTNPVVKLFITTHLYLEIGVLMLDIVTPEESTL